MEAVAEIRIKTAARLDVAVGAVGVRHRSRLIPQLLGQGIASARVELVEQVVHTTGAAQPAG